MIRLLLLVSLLALAACDGNNSAQGGGNGNSAYGRVKIGMPF